MQHRPTRRLPHHGGHDRGLLVPCFGAAHDDLAAVHPVARFGFEAERDGTPEVTDLAGFRKLYKELIEAKTKTVLLSIRRGGARMLRALSPSTKDEEEDE